MLSPNNESESLTISANPLTPEVGRHSKYDFGISE